MRTCIRIMMASLVTLACGCPGKPKPAAAPPADAGISLAAPQERTPPPPAIPRAPVPALPDPLPGERRDLTQAVGSALRAAAGDLDGDGQAEIVLADAKRLWVIDRSGHLIAETTAAGGIQVLVVADADGDGRKEIIAGWGLSRDHQYATARVIVHRLQRGKLDDETIVAPRTSRQEVAAIVPTGGGLLLAWFESKYQVKAVRATHTPAGWTLADLASFRMATSYAEGDVDGDEQPDLVVGRIYGDDKDRDGDAFVLRPDGTRTPIPATRGIRGLAIADLDGDGANEIYLGDGWAQNYGRDARGLLTRARRLDGAFRSDLVEDTPGQFTLWRILPADLDGDGRPEIVTQGSHYVRAYRMRDGAWQAITVAGATRDIAVGALDSVPGDDILTIGDRSEIISLHDAQWTPVSPAP